MMSERLVTAWVNEKHRRVPPRTSLARLAEEIRPSADVFIVNGYPEDPGYVVKANDRIVLIEKGRVPPDEELEALLVARHSPGVHERVRKACVGIAGLGGLGSTVAISLARTGIGRLILVDFDTVEPSNLNRQQFLIRHLGMAKTEALRELLGQINPSVSVETVQLRLDHGNIPDVFRRADVIVECFDSAQAKAMLLGSVHASLPGAYLILASGLAGYGGSNSIRTRRIGDRTFLVGDLESEAAPGCGLMAPRVGIAANHQANLVVGLIVSPEKTKNEIDDILDQPF
jgi:sulfur carrier protein ThiS adenylyltransferase